MKIYSADFILPISSEPILGAALAVVGQKIEAIGPFDQIRQQFPSFEVESFKHAAILPGLVFAHQHLELSELFFPYALGDRGAEPGFIRWMIEVSKKQDALNPETKRRGIQAGLQSLFENGVTTVGDLTTYEGAYRCYSESPLRVVFYAELPNLNLRLSQERFESVLALAEETLDKENPKITAGLAPYGPYSLSKNLLKLFAHHAALLGVNLQIHLGVSFSEMEFFYNSKGDIADILFPHQGWEEKLPPPHHKTPLQYLESIDFLKNAPTLVGCVQLGSGDISLMARFGLKAVVCPLSENMLKLGEAPLRRLIDAKIPIGIGAEPVASPLRFSIWDELRALKQSANAAIDAASILKIATLGGAITLGLQEKIGSLELGKEADFLVVSINPGNTFDTIAEQIIDKTNKDRILKRVIQGLEF